MFIERRRSTLVSLSDTALAPRLGNIIQTCRSHRAERECISGPRPDRPHDANCLDGSSKQRCMPSRQGYKKQCPYVLVLCPSRLFFESCVSSPFFKSYSRATHCPPRQRGLPEHRPCPATHGPRPPTAPTHAHAGRTDWPGAHTPPAGHIHAHDRPRYPRTGPRTPHPSRCRGTLTRPHCRRWCACR